MTRPTNDVIVLRPREIPEVIMEMVPCDEPVDAKFSKGQSPIPKNGKPKLAKPTKSNPGQRRKS